MIRKLLLFSLFALLTNTTLHAYDAEIDGIYYNFSGNNAEVTYDNDDPIYFYSGAVVIPSSVTYNGNTYSVTSIGNYAFYGCSSLTSITIPNSVTSIGDWAFSDCSLTSITIPNSVTSIGACAFSDCSSLTSITIPNSVTSIGHYAFSGCSSLTSITIPNSVTSIGDWAFSDCSLTSITIPNSVTSIGNSVFSGCSSLTSITIPNSVTSIGDGAFERCSGLTSVTIPESVTSIGARAFESCGSLTSVNIPNGVTKISDGTFSGCSSLTSITIPNSVTSIGDYAFESCSGLASVTIPESVTSIGARAFESCSSLTSITIPNSVTSIGYYAFGGCTGLTSVTIPNSVTSFGNSVFESCSSLTSITIPNSVTSIEAMTFSGCSSLTSVTIPNSVTSIDYKAFSNCSGLTSVTIPNSVTSIDEGAFFGCSSLTSITIPGSVTSIGNSAFGGCTGLTSITVESGNTVYDSRNNCNAIIETSSNTLIAGFKNTVIPSTVTSIGYYAFEGCSITSVTIPESVTSIGYYAFGGCTGLASVTIPNSVTSIEGYAFAGCSITSVTIPESVTSIGDGAFDGCECLTSVTIESDAIMSASGEEGDFCSRRDIFGYQVETYILGDAVTSIGNSAFAGCSSLTSITIPNSVTSIGNYAFDECSGLTSVHISDLEAWCKISFESYKSNPLASAHHLFLNGEEIRDLVIPNSVTSIGNYAFEGCSGLTSVTIPNSVTSIGQYAFSYCTSLTSFIIPNGVTSIGYHAFRGCTGLTSVTIPNSVTSIGQGAFFACNGLTSVVSKIQEPFAFGSDAFFNISSRCVLTIPAGTRDAYIAAGWTENIFRCIVEDGASEPGFSNNKQYLIHTRDKIRGSLGVTEKHLASNNPTATGPWVCKPIVLDKDHPLITSVSQLSSPNTEPTEGSLNAMIDGNAGTFWHSAWSVGDVENGQHYFQVEMLDQADIDVAFKVTRRKEVNDHITEWGIYGTNSANATKANCTKLAVIETPYSNGGETRVSNIFKTEGYKYLRFYINNTSTSRGFGHLAEFQLYPATIDEAYGNASPFAIIQKNGGYYLYSVLDKAFITPDNDGDESAHPLLPNDNKMNIYKRGNHFVFDFIDTGYIINVNNNGVEINDYGTLIYQFDEGNQFTIEEVGDFDPTEALAKFEMQTFTVTYNVMYEGNIVETATEEVAVGEALPPAPASLDNGFVTLTKTGTHPTTVTEDVTVTYTAEWNGPFEFTKTETSAKWYNMHIRSGRYVGKQDWEPYYPAQADEATLATPAYQWAFGGDPYHVKVYNRTTGLSETLTKDGENAVMRSGDYTWDLLSNSDGFVLRITGTEHSCINQLGGYNGPLRFWDDVNSQTDDGSTFRVEEATVIEPTDDTFTVSDLTLLSGDIYGFTVSLSGSGTYSAYNLDIAIPQGINVMYEESGGKKVAYAYMYEDDGTIYPYTENPITHEKTFTHTVTGQVDNSGNLRVACSSNESAEFTGTSGILFTVYVTIDDATFAASYSPKPIVKLSGLNLTTSAAVKYVPADFACRPFTTGIPTARTIPVNVSAANKIGTLILPFDTELPSGLKAYSCNAAEGDLLTLTPEESIEACTPYIVYAENGYSGNLSGTVDMSADYGTTDVFAEGYLTGVLSSTTISTGYILQNQGDGPLFYDADGVTFSLPAGRCYLTPSGAGVKAFGFDFEDDATAIEMVNGKSVNGKLYDLSGRQVTSPTSGIYIQGTRKVFIK